MLSSVAGEVSVVAVDHRQTGAHVAGKVEGRDPCTEREGREGVAEIVDPARGSIPAASWAGAQCRLRKLCRSKWPPSEAGKTSSPCSRGRASSAAKARACSRTERMLASVFGYLTRPFR